MGMRVDEAWEKCLVWEADIGFNWIDAHFFDFSLTVDEDLYVGMEIAVNPGIICLDNEILKIDHGGWVLNL